MAPDVSDGVLTESLVVLSPSNKQALLSAASEETLRRQAEANTILASLKQLNPIIAKHFHPKQTAIADLTLRMLCSHAPAPGVELVVPSFIVISYCWHYPGEWTLAPAGQAQQLKPGWEISQPMADAVLSLRTCPDEGVWLDRLCIKQSDESEKAVAVGAMDVVYRSARRLLILLEDVQLDAGEEEAAVTYAGFYEDMRRFIVDNGIEGAEREELIRRSKYSVGREGEPDEEVVQNLWEDGRRFAKKLLTARWFSRAWGAHESRVLTHPVKGNNPLFLCFGADGRVLSFEFRFVHYHTLRLFNAEPWPSSFEFTDFNDPNPVSIRQLFTRLQRLRSDPVESGLSLMQYLDGITSLGCLKKEDMVSMILNMARLPLFYSGHLNTCEDVVWVVTLLAIASGDVLPLVTQGIKLKVPENDRTKAIVSWVDQPRVLTSRKQIPLVDSRSITAVTKEYIELDILLFTDLPKKPSQASLGKASALAKAHSLNTLNHYLSTGYPEQVQNAHKYRQSHSYLQDFTQTWLALALDCGIDWIKRLLSLLIEQTADRWYWGQVTANSLFPAFRNKFEAVAIDLLSLIGKNEENTPDFAKSYLDPTVKFFEYLLDSRLKILAIHPRGLCMGSSDWAITQRTANTTWIAVPASVAHLPLWQEKAWVIESFDPDAPPERPEDPRPDMTKKYEPNLAQEDIWPVLNSDNASRRAPRNDDRGTWRLRHRQAIFGCQSIVPDGKSVILLKKQKVYGAENYDWAAIFSLPQSISSKSSAHDAVGTTKELVVLLMENTQLRSFYPSLRQNFEFTAFKSELHQLLRVFSKDLSKEALIPIEKESVRFVSQQRRRVLHAIGQEVFGLKDQSVFQSISQRQQLDTRERIEKYLKDATQPTGGGDELSLQQEYTSDNDSTDDDELEPFSNLEHVKKFLIKSKAFENLRISIGKLAAQGEESTTEVRSRYGVVESENKAWKDEKLSDIAVKQSPLSGMVIPEPRTILRSRRLNFVATLRRCSWAVLRLFRPKLEIGYQRLEWQCDCGTPLYGDFRGDSGEISKLVREIQAHGYVITQSGHGIKQMPAGSRQTTTSNSAVSAPLGLNTSHTAQNPSLNPTGTTSRALGGTQNPTVVTTVTATPQLPVAGESPKFVALCVNTGPFQKTYDEIDISTIPKSAQMFHNFKKTYEACVGSRKDPLRRWLTKPVDIGFIQFAVEGLRRVYPIPGSPDCTICAHAEKRDELVTARKYEPHINTVALTHPPIPPDLFFHLWECPVHITPTVQNMWLNRLPKKLDEKLENACLRTRPDGELILGWGVLVIEGLHKRRISRLTATIVALSIVVSVAYSAGMKDLSSGFAVGALLVGCWTLFITALYFEWAAG